MKIAPSLLYPGASFSIRVSVFCTSASSSIFCTRDCTWSVTQDTLIDPDWTIIAGLSVFCVGTKRVSNIKQTIMAFNAQMNRRVFFISVVSVICHFEWSDSRIDVRPTGGIPLNTSIRQSQCDLWVSVMRAIPKRTSLRDKQDDIRKGYIWMGWKSCSEKDQDAPYCRNDRNILFFSY